MTSSDTYRLLAVADSDSYAKWAAGIIDTLPGDWDTDLAIVRTPIAPSGQQIAAAVAGTRLASNPPKTLTARGIRRLVSATRPDVVLLAATGPVVDVLMSRTLAGLQQRPAFVSGLPGISVPATERAILFRSAVDLFVVHSHREVDEFDHLATSMGAELSVGLATLPSLKKVPTPVDNVTRDRVVFAPQALVPKAKDKREKILLALAEFAEKNPEITPVVKLRATAGEAQTHRERLAYDELWQGLVQSRRLKPHALQFETGSMLEHLQHATGFVTVSSTAALEAISSGVPTLVLSDFGVSAKMINIVFEGSGLLGTLDDLVASRFQEPYPTWLRNNYYHPEADCELLPRLELLAEAARKRALVARPMLMEKHEHGDLRRRSVQKLYIHPRILRWRNQVVDYSRRPHHNAPRRQRNSPLPSTQALGHSPTPFRQAQHLNFTKQPEQAARVLEQALKQRTLTTTELRELALSYRQLGRFREARTALDQAHADGQSSRRLTRDLWLTRTLLVGDIVLRRLGLKKSSN